MVQQLQCAQTTHRSIQPGREVTVAFLAFLVAEAGALSGPKFGGALAGLGLGSITGFLAGVTDQVAGSGTCN